ncbi:hypothetical protein N7G274_002064 [Stereocaulon virgatum]|uniref:Nephrocystin 3-like N-terminal domain-containing protein n=1 Tax=Stereocaulon virgatum TaxID=373712 RepID=A0ABR4ALA5_9LECA
MLQTGLLKSTLYQILTRSPSLIPRFLPDRWEALCLFGHDDSPWREVELWRAFRLLARVDAAAARFCLFIDGLDEIDGDRTDMTNLLKDVASSKNVKICVSGRPWIVFEDVFKTKPSLMLQDLTHPDIKHFVDSSFHDNLEKREPRYAGRLLKGYSTKGYRSVSVGYFGNSLPTSRTRRCG